MFVYIAFRFEWPFAVGAVVTMFLDVTKTVGFLALTGFEFNLAAIAAHPDHHGLLDQRQGRRL